MDSGAVLVLSEASSSKGSKPAPLVPVRPRLTLRTPSRTPCIPPHWNSLFLLNHIVQVGQSALELPAVDRLGRFAGIFERYAEIGAASSGGLSRFYLGCCVPDLIEGVSWEWSGCK